MGADSKIEWTDHTFNPWIGCAHVSPGCDHCYAEVGTSARIARGRGLPLWGEQAHRQVTSADYWKQPLRWDRAAARDGVRRRVFCASLADVFEDRRDLDEPRARLWALIEATPHLDWLLLTKRPQNVAGMVPPAWLAWNVERRGWPCNARIGCTVEDQQRAAERLPHLLAGPWLNFVSYEPAIEGVDFRPSLSGRRSIPGVMPPSVGFQVVNRIDWLIVGGESGPGARPFDLAWARSTVEACRAAGVPAFVKQLGARPVSYPDPLAPATQQTFALSDRKGGDMAEWPEDLQVRQLPEVR